MSFCSDKRPGLLPWLGLAERSSTVAYLKGFDRMVRSYGARLVIAFAPLPTGSIAHTDTILPLLQFWKLQGNIDISRFYARGIAILGAIVLITDYLGYRRGVEFPELFRRWNPYVVAGLAAACYFGITIFARRETAQFIYFQF